MRDSVASASLRRASPQQPFVEYELSPVGPVVVTQRTAYACLLQCRSIVASLIMDTVVVVDEDMAVVEALFKLDCCHYAT